MVKPKVSVVIDAMGGDYAPTEIVKGIVETARRKRNDQFILVGPSKVLNEELNRLAKKRKFPNITIVDAPEIISMAEEASRAIRSKPNSSIVKGIKLVREGQADAFISAGNTGAVMSAALFTYGRIKGVKRPAIAIPIPIPTGQFLLLDAGANSDCRPDHLLQFAQMGAVYTKRVLGVPNPKIGLLNIGGEEEKGNELTKEAYRLLKKSTLNFIGNVEGREMFLGKADVVVCDGFTGNVVLKVMEGAAMTVLSLMKRAVSGSLRAMLGGWLMLPALGELRKKADYEEYGGAQLLGVNGVCIISHGGSRAKAIKNAVNVAIRTVRENVVKEIEEGLAGS